MRLLDRYVLITFLKNYLELNQDHLPVGLCLSRLNDFAKAVFRANFKDLSRDIFRFIIKKNDKEIQEDAIFFYLWTYITAHLFSWVPPRWDPLRAWGARRGRGAWTTPRGSPATGCPARCA